MNRIETSPSSVDAATQIRAIADSCVKCGLCIERCPSYRVLQREQDSPRGRIALAAALAQGQLAADDATALAALDRCLNCGTCTRVCPADVHFDRLIDLTRAAFPAPEPAARRGARWLTRHRGVLRVLRPLARSLARSPLRRALPEASASAAMLDVMAHSSRVDDTRPAPAFTPAIALRRGSVALFRGCVAGTLDADTQQAAARVLACLGFDVHMPGANHCCGALDRHHGDAREAATRGDDAHARYRAVPVSHVLGTVSGCHAQLRDHVFTDATLAYDDLFEFLDRDTVLPTLVHRALPLRIALHVPCTQRDVAGKDTALRRVLARIPGLDIASLPEEPVCCGAAGTYFADHPRIANALRDERVTQVRQQSPDRVLTTNIGCRMHLAAGLANAGVAVPVVHPITLLELALRESAA
ncbi:MAG: (Fe-S)-binding protein [Lysobacterales bacterium]